jgi:hypothetical protein
MHEYYGKQESVNICTRTVQWLKPAEDGHPFYIDQQRNTNCTAQGVKSKQSPNGSHSGQVHFPIKVHRPPRCGVRDEVKKYNNQVYNYQRDASNI